jgi:hypothetical protein
MNRRTIVNAMVLAGAAVIPALAQDTATNKSAVSLTELSGIWAHTSLYALEPPLSGPGPVRNRSRLREGPQAGVGIPCSRHDPKILRLDDAKVVGDLIAENGPIAGDLFAQEAEGRVGKLGASSVAFVVGDVSVHDAP